MDWTWDTAHDWYASLKIPPGVEQDSYTEKMERLYAMMVALIEQIRGHPHLSQYKPGTMAMILSLMPPGTSKRIFVTWNNNHYEVALGIITPDNLDPDFPEGRAYASLDEVIDVLERFAAYLEGHLE